MEEESKSPIQQHKRNDSADIFSFSSFNNTNIFNVSTHQTPDSSFVEQSSQQQYKPTKVLFVRGVTNDTSEFDLSRILSNYGEVEKVKLLIQKNQAFVQFKSLEGAQYCIENQEEIFVNNKRLHFSYSGREQIIEDRVEQFCSEPNKVLLVTITNVKFPNNAEVLNTVFLKYGEVCKVVLFQRMQGEQALIEMRSVEQAKKAKEDLDGKFIYSNSNLMKIQYSQLKNLEVNQQNERARDFTLTKQYSQQQEQQISDDFSKEDFMSLFKNAYDKVSNQQTKNINIASTIKSTQMDSKVLKQWDPLMDPSDYVEENQQPLQQNVQQNSQSQCIFQNEDILSQISQTTAHNKVLIVSNLPYNTTPLVLFKLFGVYGNVMKVKIMYKKRDNALVEFQDYHQACTAKQYLNGIPFFGSNLNVNESKVPSISVPQPGTEEANLTVDYTLSKEHRFKIQGSKNIQNIAVNLMNQLFQGPSQILHISNFGYEMANEAAFRNLFSKVAQPIMMRFFQTKGKPQAFAKFLNLNDSVRILVIFHNYDINGLHLKVSFSKTSF